MVTFVLTMLGTVLVVEYILPALTNPVTNKDAEVIPTDKFNVLELILVVMKFVLVSVPIVALVTLALVN